MRILEEKLGKSAEHWKTDEKCQGKCRFESIVWSFLFVVVFFCLFVLSFFNMFAFLSPTRLKETNPDSTNDSIPDSNLHVSWLFFQCSADFPSCFLQNQHFAAKFLLFFYVYFMCSEYSVESLFSSCFYVFFCFVWFLFCFQLCFWIVFFKYIYI